jgi:DNA-binding Lrp family transcriptional regulator
MAKNDFLAEFMGGEQARARLLRVFILDQERGHTAREAAKRAGLSEKAALRELKALERWGVVKKGKPLSIMLKGGRRVTGKQKTESWGIDLGFKHLRALTAFVTEVSPIKYNDVVSVLKTSGRIATIVLSGTFTGDPSRPADILIAGDTLNERKLDQAIRSLEPIYGREIRYAAFSTPEFRYRLTIQDRLLRDTLDFPHLVLLDRAQLL